MRDQYAGDVSDFLKFGLLRALVATDRTLGVAWYYIPGDDGRADGRHLEWREEPAWQTVDAQLYTHLSTLPERSVAALERAAIWPKGTLFYREAMPVRSQRSSWGVKKRHALAGADIVFLDPDNGVEARSGRHTPKHATLDEIRKLRQPRKVIVFISFPSFSRRHAVQLQELHHRLKSEVNADSVMTLATNVSVPRAPGSSSVVQRARWFTLVDSNPALASRAIGFADALESVPRVRVSLHTIK